MAQEIVSDAVMVRLRMTKLKITIYIYVCVCGVCMYTHNKRTQDRTCVMFCVCFLLY